MPARTKAHQEGNELSPPNFHIIRSSHKKSTKFSASLKKVNKISSKLFKIFKMMGPPAPHPFTSFLSLLPPPPTATPTHTPNQSPHRAQTFTLTSFERAALYRDQVQGNIESAVVSIVKQVVRGDFPFIIQTKVTTSMSAARFATMASSTATSPMQDGAESGSEFEEEDFTQTPSFVQNGGWSWKAKSTNKQILPRLPAGLMYVKFGNRTSQRKFVLQVHLMSKIYGMVIRCGSCTIRDLYYENVALYGTQKRLEGAIYDLCHVLKVPREALRIEATSKGIMAGSLRFKTTTGDVINLSHFKSGMLIPSLSSLDDMCDIESDARQILVIEKDAVFQRLIDERIFEELGPTILITGKGYPDLVTLKMIRKLKDALNLTVFALVDCDAYGVEIASVIRWGSYKQASIAKCANDWSIADELTVPDLVWLGLLPSEIADLSLKNRASVEMTSRDRYKVHLVKQRILSNPDPVWIDEINILQNSSHKAELEALFIHPRFANFYIQQKLNAYFRVVNPEML